LTASLKLHRKILRFVGAGTVGFVIDAVVFFMLLRGLNLHFVACRVTASLIAMLATWSLNRQHAFHDGKTKNRIAELVRYILASSSSIAVNLATLALVFPHDAQFLHVPAYILGAAAGMVANYILYDRLVFRGETN
jgi:putative flippase GtrA